MYVCFISYFSCMIMARTFHQTCRFSRAFLNEKAVLVSPKRWKGETKQFVSERVLLISEKKQSGNHQYTSCNWKEGIPHSAQNLTSGFSNAWRDKECWDYFYSLTGETILGTANCSTSAHQNLCNNKHQSLQTRRQLGIFAEQPSL